ncbi:hypothetical protein RradSPS_1333 [Rubrobacter radiotolerans]|uniref:MOSC domain-containing protein n=1 Tax=Rubrobacter radiotolerans TaxID=42256 RepID=A0A023X365_RUBRA|nr:MOSC domain-containing protein [Rubrobacter radiotolerans]AHY46616.1 hypothetical protein RradSPS_1333 [Rubrobacter radiotolerans]MDX5894023.1 MOSC domain-containing protein [Rubrobacter radiotolerans]SMC05002.1 MOSC domain-containing protein YiiM [Rubrobacter radiotolerans DSM 5868]
MKLLSVNVGSRRRLAGAGKSGFTGIFKEPRRGPVLVRRSGLDGDAIVDAANHGGPDQAVYVFSLEDYRWWSREVGRELLPGTFGENLTVAGVESAALNVGDRLLVGREVVLEVTAPRIPCGTLSARMGDRLFPKKFRAAERPGFYCRVLQTGEVRAGDAVALEPYSGGLEPPLSIIESFREFFSPERSEAALRRHLAAPIAVRDREEKERLLAEFCEPRSESRGRE